MWREIGLDDRLSVMFSNPGFIMRAEMWVTSALAILPALGTGMVASTLARRRVPGSGALGRGVIAFVRGTLVGVGFFGSLPEGGSVCP